MLSRFCPFFVFADFIAGLSAFLGSHGAAATKLPQLIHADGRNISWKNSLLFNNVVI